jgi:hypothetical protein
VGRLLDGLAAGRAGRLELLPVIGAAFRGLKKTLAAPGLVLAAWLLTVVATLPATVALGHGMQQSFGRTLAAEKMAEGFDSGWYGEYGEDGRGIERAFDPTTAGVGGVLANLEGWADGSMLRLPPGLIGLAVVFVLAWALFLGGAIERYAFEDARRGVSGTLAAGGRYWARFVRLAVLSGVVYYGVYRLHGWLMDRAETRLLDVTEETCAMWTTLAIYAATAFLLVAVRACFDYAKIAIVVEDRKSALLSALQGVAFVITHPISALGLVLAIAFASAGPLALYVWLRPSVVTPGWGGVIWAILVGQLWIVTRLVLRLTLVAGQTSLYRAASASPTSSVSRGR